MIAGDEALAGDYRCASIAAHYHAALRKAGVPVELHLYVKRGHAFGMRRTNAPITRWPSLVEQWLGTIGMIVK